MKYKCICRAEQLVTKGNTRAFHCCFFYASRSALRASAFHLCHMSSNIDGPRRRKPAKQRANTPIGAAPLKGRRRTRSTTKARAQHAQGQGALTHHPPRRPTNLRMRTNRKYCGDAVLPKGRHINIYPQNAQTARRGTTCLHTKSRSKHGGHAQTRLPAESTSMGCTKPTLAKQGGESAINDEQSTQPPVAQAPKRPTKSPGACSPDVTTNTTREPSGTPSVPSR